MGRLPLAGYDAALRLLRPALRLAAPRGSKVRRGVDGRRLALTALRSWAAAGREPGKPLVWLHAPSVGEALMAQAIVAALRRERPDLQVAFTFFSPSAERVAERVGADVAVYLPWDTRAENAAALDALRPDAIGFVRTEIWPGLVAEAERRGVRLAIVNAALGPGSSRIRPAGRLLLGPSYRRLDAVGAVAAEDAARFATLGVAPERVRVTGDARFDQVWDRAHALDRGSPLLRRLRPLGGLTLVAGSTWPADEARLLPAFAAARRRAPWRLIAAPHEPTESHLARLEKALDAQGLAHERLGTLEAAGTTDADVLLLDRVGVLADAYAVADAAYVGGGFGGSGLHSVVEPAALGVPVLFGPRLGNAREARALAADGGGAAVGDSPALEARLNELAADEQARSDMGGRAEAFVRTRTGAAKRNAALLLELLDQPLAARR